MLSDEEYVSNDKQNDTSENSDDNDEEDIFQDDQYTAPDWDGFDDVNDFTYLNSSTEFPES
jgi:hypothetical protein